VVVFHTPFCFKVIWKIALIQLRHFCIGRKLSFGQTAAICITPAYSDRLASGFRPTAAETFLFSAWFNLAADAVLCWTYAVSAKTTLQIIESLRRISRRVCVRCYRVDFHLFTSLWPMWYVSVS